MKTTKIIIAALAALLAASSCTSKMEITAPAGNGNIITEITASFDDTKTALQEDGKIFWEVGDAINLFYNKEGAKFTSTVTAPSAVSKFSGTLDILFGSEGDKDETKGGLTGAEDYLWGVYPYNEANTSDGSSVTAVIPTKQIAREGTFAKDAYLTVGRSDTPVMGFYAVGGAIKFKLSRNDIQSVTIRGNKNEAIAGKAKIIFTDGLPVATISSANAKPAITLEAPEGEALKADTEYYIAMAPVTFAEGFEMIFTTSDNKTGSRKSNVANELKRRTIANIGVADTDVEFVQKHWSAPTVVPYKAGTLAFEINPVSKKPELAIVQNVDGSKGPVLYFSDIKSAPVTVSPDSKANNQYIALGIDAAGKSYVFSHDATAKLGAVYSSSDKASWTMELSDIQATNMYYGNTIGCLGNEVFVMTCNDKAGGVLNRRAVNITKFDGSTWNYNIPLANSVTDAAAYYYPLIRVAGGAMYTFVTNSGKGFTLCKYDGSNWSELDAFDATAEPYSKYSYGINEHQDMAIAPDGQIWFAISGNTSKLHYVAKYNPESKEFTQIANGIATTNSISYRSCRLGINPVNEDVYFVYRDDNQCLWVARLDDQTFDKWVEAEQLTYSSAADVEVRFNADGKGYIVCTTGDHVEVFDLL